MQSLIAGLLLLLLAACNPQLPPPPLTLGMGTWVGYDPLVLARDKNLIDPKLVKVVELSSSAETLRHFRNGLLDAAALTLDEAIQLADEGIHLRIVAVLDASTGADVVLAAPGIQDLTQLKGRTIALESSTVGALVLKRMLEAANLQPSDLSVLNMEAAQHLAALESHRATVAVSYEPWAATLRAAGYHTIFDSRQMPGDIVDVLVVSENAALGRPAHVEALLIGWEKGLEALRADPASSAALLASGVDFSPDQYLDTLHGLTFYSPDESLAALSGTSPAFFATAERLAQALLDMQLLSKKPDWGKLLDVGPVERVRLRGSPR